MKRLGRKYRMVTVFFQGKPLMTCFSVTEAQYQTGHVVNTIREYSQHGLQTVDGYSYKLGALKNDRQVVGSYQK